MPSLERTRTFASDRRGSAAVEFALVVPVMLIALVGLMDYGLMVYENTRLSQAASAGAKFAIMAGNEDDDAGIIAAVRDALPDSYDTVTIAVTRECRCPTGAAVQCNVECTGEIAPGRYLEVTVNQDYPLIFDYPHVGNEADLQSHAVIRIPD